jgi:hypothetical protein
MSNTQGAALDFKVGNVASQTGPNRAMVVIFKIKPGHEQQAKADLAAFGGLLEKNGEPWKLGLHEAKLTTFDDDTRLFFITTFDPEVDPYLDDAIARLWPAIHTWARHCEGYTGTMDQPETDGNKIKSWWMTNWNTCTVYYRPYARTFHEITNALTLSDAFQTVLDNPAAAKALQDPALKPLLDLAST